MCVYIQRERNAWFVQFSLPTVGWVVIVRIDNAGPMCVCVRVRSSTGARVVSSSSSLSRGPVVGALVKQHWPAGHNLSPGGADVFFFLILSFFDYYCFVSVFFFFFLSSNRTNASNHHHHHLLLLLLLAALFFAPDRSPRAVARGTD